MSHVQFCEPGPAVHLPLLFFISVHWKLKVLTSVMLQEPAGWIHLFSLVCDCSSFPNYQLSRVIIAWLGRRLQNKKLKTAFVSDVFFFGGGNYATVFEVISPVFTMYFRFYLFYFTAECQREKRWADKGKREKVGGTRKIIRNIKGNLLCFFMFSFNSVVCKCSCACKRSSKFKKSTPTETTSWILNFVTCWHDFLLCACLYWQ